VFLLITQNGRREKETLLLGVVVVEPLVFVMMVSTTAVGVGVNCEVKFFTQNRVPL